MSNTVQLDKALAEVELYKATCMADDILIAQQQATITEEAAELNTVWNTAIAQAMDECLVSAKREKGSVGARNCMEIREALFELHITSLKQEDK